MGFVGGSMYADGQMKVSHSQAQATSTAGGGIPPFIESSKTYGKSHWGHVVAYDLSKDEADNLLDIMAQAQYGEVSAKYDLDRDAWVVSQMFTKVVLLP